MVLAPERLSITTCWPSCSPSFSPISRPRKSAGPPGANGTIRVIGRDGYGCASESDGRTASKTAAQIRRCRIDIIVRLSDFDVGGFADLDPLRVLRRDEGCKLGGRVRLGFA